MCYVFMCVVCKFISKIKVEKKSGHILQRLRGFSHSQEGALLSQDPTVEAPLNPIGGLQFNTNEGVT